MSPSLFGARWCALALSCITASSLQAQTAPDTLPETTVLATRVPVDREAIGLGVTVLTAEDIRASGATTVNEALMRLLGIPGRIDYYGGGNYTLDLRGFGETANSNQVIVVDGVRLNEADLGVPQLATIPIDSIERIEVVRGSGAVLYGEGATGGVIVITTKAGAGVQRRSGAQGYAAAGTHHLRELRAQATLAVGGFSLDVNGQRRDSDNHRDNFRSELDAHGLALQWAGDAVRVGIRHWRDDLSTGLPGGISLAEFQSNPRKADSTDDRAKIRNEGQSMFGEWLVDDWRLAAELAQRKKALRSLSGGWPFDYDVDANQGSLRATHDGKLGGMNNRLTVGYDALHWERQTHGSWGDQRSHRSHGWYVQDQLQLSSGQRLTAGWRSERLNKSAKDGAVRLNDRVNAWELGVQQPLADGARLWGRVGRSYRLANVDEFGFTRPGDILRPQWSRDLEVGFGGPVAGGKGEVRLYRSQLTDEIGYDPTVANPNSWSGFGANVNYAPTRRQGVEAEWSRALTPALRMDVVWQWRDAKFRAGDHVGRRVPLVPRQSAAVRWQWQPAAAHRVWAGVNWVDRQAVSHSNACQIPAYATADVRYAYAWRDVELSVAVNNLTDRRYYSTAFGCAAGQPTSLYPEAGRTVVVALRARF